MNTVLSPGDTADRMARTFSRTRDGNGSALVTFVMAGHPDPSAFPSILAALPEAGADIIEIGMPFSDPMADGPVIQAAGKRALDHGTNLEFIFETVSGFRRDNDLTPIVLMGYFNPIYRYGCARFAADAAAAGVDGLIIVDLPPEEDAELRTHTDPLGIHWIRLIAPTTDPDRRARLLKDASGFVYCVSITGITGTATASAARLETMVADIRELTATPVGVGFGIRTPEQAARVAKLADAVVVGTALVEKLADESGPGPALDYVRALKSAIG